VHDGDAGTPAARRFVTRMARIDIWVHGRGRGHATRCAEIARLLQREGHELRAFAGADALPILRGVLPTSPVDSLAPRLGLATPARLLRRVARACAEIRRWRPRVVVADGDLPAVLAARICGVPSVAVGHGLVFSGCERPRQLPALPWWREAIKARVSTLGARRSIAVGFVELPARSPATVLARASVAPLVCRSPRDLVVYFRDGIAAAELACIRAADPDAHVFAPGGRPTTHPIDRSAFVAALGHARAVVATAGSQLISECVAWGIPLLAVYDEADDEQRLNAAMLEQVGLGVAVARDRLDARCIGGFMQRFRSARATAWPSVDAATAVGRACAELLAEAGA
jgi:UDP-N-acetylglucosamine--N-acetylmuramyl-(pentapeptide) pyrophosphoryl-undecaprenol N-acetylglucosamine transferase